MWTNPRAERARSTALHFVWTDVRKFSLRINARTPQHNERTSLWKCRLWQFASDWVTQSLRHTYLLRCARSFSSKVRMNSPCGKAVKTVWSPTDIFQHFSLAPRVAFRQNPRARIRRSRKPARALMRCRRCGVRSCGIESNRQAHKDSPLGETVDFHSISTPVEIATGTGFLDEPLGQGLAARRAARKSS